MKFRSLRAIIRRRVRYRITSAGILFTLALALTGIGAFLSANNLLFLVFSAMVALILVSGFLSRLVLSGLEIELLLPEHVSARTPAPARLRIRNLKRLMPSFSIELSGLKDAVTNTPPILTAPVYFPLVAGRAIIETPIQVIFPYRGRHKENVFVLSTKFPFGFLRKTATVALRRETTVYPELQASEAAALALEAAVGELEAEMRGMGRDFYSIRPYLREDSARHVDWKSTAHTGRLQVREFSRDQQRTVEIYLDRRIAAGEQDWFERAIESCAWIVWSLTGTETELLFRSQRHSLFLPEDGDVYDILRFLALVEPIVMISGDGPAKPPNPAEPPTNDSNYQIVFSSRPDDFLLEGWRAAHLLSPTLRPDTAAEN